MKKLFILVLLALFAHASNLDDTIKSYVGASKYESQKNLINVLFASPKSFMRSNGEVDSIKVMEVL